MNPSEVGSIRSRKRVSLKKDVFRKARNFTKFNLRHAHYITSKVLFKESGVNKMSNILLKETKLPVTIEKRRNSTNVKCKALFQESYFPDI